MRARQTFRGPAIILLISVALASSGCQRQALVATPNILIDQDPERVFAACPTCSQVPSMDVLYATDRQGTESRDDPTYSYVRDRRLAFGTATVALQPEPTSMQSIADLAKALGPGVYIPQQATWSQLIADSTRANRRTAYSLRTERCKQLGSFDLLLERIEPHGNGVRLASEAVSDFHRQQHAFHGMLTDRLDHTAQKDVYVFVHGVDNSFDDALFRAAEVWHFMGRAGVPVVYSWPAGFGGIRGYAYDRESSEFTVFHFKCFLQMLATCRGVERIHIVAHSRGTDVAISALRELNIAYVAAGKDTQAELKLENLVLAAPDLDEDVFMQRFVAENLLNTAHRTTIYTSTSDRMIGLSDLVFASKRRVGALGPRDFSPEVRKRLAKLPSLQFIDCKVTHFSTSHDYVFAHPAALSDLILVLRDRLPPGAPGRPLLQPAEGIWEIHNDYAARKN
jgi:esterase/lipase superfamily enzyme